MTPSTGGRLPDFLVIGAFKSGTTSLCHLLGTHPQVFLPALQEPNYFASPRYRPYDDGLRRPRRTGGGAYGRLRTDSLSQYTELFAPAPADAVVGECSPWYLRDPAACARIAATTPDVRLLAILRHPADRAYSGWSHLSRDGVETGSFVDAVNRPPGVETGRHYVETGFYGRQLRPYVETFAPDRLRVVLYEDLRDDAPALLRSLFGWLGVDPGAAVPTGERRNVSGRPRNRAVAAAWAARRRLQPWLGGGRLPARLQRAVDRRLVAGLRREPIDPAVRDALTDRFADDIRLLAELTGRDLTHWLAPTRVPR